MLLRAVADKLIPGIPENVRILLVTQIQEEGEDVDQLTIVQSVVKADVNREKALDQYQRMPFLRSRRKSVDMSLTPLVLSSGGLADKVQSSRCLRSCGQYQISTS